MAIPELGKVGGGGWFIMWPGGGDIMKLGSE